MAENPIESMAEHAEEAAAQAEEAVRDVVHNPWVERLTRLGYGVRGLIYTIVAILAAEVALGARSQAGDYEDAFELIGAQPFGPALLLVAAVGLGGLALWGFSRVVYDPLAPRGDDPNYMARLGAFISGLSYTGLLLTALRVLTEQVLRVPTGPEQPEGVATAVLGTPGGQWLVGLIGVGAGLGGLAEVIKAVFGDFTRELKPFDLSPRQARWASRLGRGGTFARGIVVLLVGIFLVQAAIRADPEDVRGLDEALLALAREPHGPALLALVAAGLMAFGAYSLLGAVWFRLRRTSP